MSNIITQRRWELISIPLTEAERAELKRQHIEEAQSWEPPTTRTEWKPLMPGDDGYENAPFGENVIYNEGAHWKLHNGEFKKPEIIEDGLGGSWSKTCAMCGENSMHVVRPGEAQCWYCG